MIRSEQLSQQLKLVGLFIFHCLTNQCLQGKEASLESMLSIDCTTLLERVIMVKFYFNTNLASQMKLAKPLVIHCFEFTNIVSSSGMNVRIVRTVYLCIVLYDSRTIALTISCRNSKHGTNVRIAICRVL